MLDTESDIVNFAANIPVYSTVSKSHKGSRLISKDHIEAVVIWNGN
jgi:hypothetical protein